MVAVVRRRGNHFGSVRGEREYLTAARGGFVVRRKGRSQMRLAVGGLNFEWWLWEQLFRAQQSAQPDGGGRGLAVASRPNFYHCTT